MMEPTLRDAIEAVRGSLLVRLLQDAANTVLELSSEHCGVEAHARGLGLIGYCSVSDYEQKVWREAVLTSAAGIALLTVLAAAESAAADRERADANERAVWCFAHFHAQDCMNCPINDTPRCPGDDPDDIADEACCEAAITKWAHDCANTETGLVAFSQRALSLATDADGATPA